MRPQADLAALKARLARDARVAQLPLFSTNDVVAALAWLLSCDSRSRPRPGQKPCGCVNRILLMVDLSNRGLPPGLVPSGYVGNLTEAVQPTCTSDGTCMASPNSPDSMMYSLAGAVVAVRSAILAASQPGWALQALAVTCGRQTAQGFGEYVDAARQGDIDTRITNWNTLDNRVDFGTGAGLAGRG